ncbi:imm11 family protein [Flavobacterium tructae]|uniref:imm11 family protein n=1 Tax=Flavobacterium tructae TaxID=1114873 RepID=UPI0035A9771D
MKYYSIKTSLNKKILGHYPQVKNVKYNCHVWDEPKFIEHVHFEKIDFEPITANAVLYAKSKLTDLISAYGMGFTLKPLVSKKLKEIFENNRKTGLQFFRSPIIQNDCLINDYWILNMYEIDMNFIDLTKSSIVQRIKKPEGGTTLIDVEIESLESFMTEIASKKLEGELYFKNIIIKDNILEDFFLLRYVEGGAKYVVSEKLKKEIEDAGCTGIEFQSVELSTVEWLYGGEREKIYGKA